jgi:integrase/recombinase XerD
MTSTSSKTLQALVQDFFVKYLAIERNVSRNTIAGYRDAIKLFLQHVSSVRACSPDQLGFEILDVGFVRSFLVWLERDRGCAARTRNHRLAVLKSFARYVATVAPEHLEHCRLIRELPRASFERPAISYLDDDEVVKLVAAVGVSTPAGRRDRALLLLLYNTGARVQEIVDLDVGSIQVEGIAVAHLRGKGRKQRACPLWSRTMMAIRHMLADRPAASHEQPLFLGARGGRLTRSGIAYLLRRAGHQGGLSPRHAKRLSPHVIRHTTAMHLLQSGVDITTIAAWLGHAQLSTTHGYVEIDLRMKQAATDPSAALPDLATPAYPEPHVIDWLEKLGRQAGYVQPVATERSDSSTAWPTRTPLRITVRGP